MPEDARRPRSNIACAGEGRAGCTLSPDASSWPPLKLTICPPSRLSRTLFQKNLPPRPARRAILRARTLFGSPCPPAGGRAHYAQMIARGVHVRVAAGLICALVASIGAFGAAGPAGATPPSSTTTTLPPPALAELLI